MPQSWFDTVDRGGGTAAGRPTGEPSWFDRVDTPPTMPAAATAGMLQPSTVPEAPTHRESPWFVDAARVPGQVATGAVKGAASTVSHLGDLARKIPGVVALDRFMTPIDVDITPRNTAERIGFTGEQIAEVALPASKVATLAKATRLPVRMAAEAATSAGVAGAQTGGDSGTMTAAGAAGAAGPAVAGVARWVTQALPERLYSRVFSSTRDALERTWRAAGNNQPVPQSLAREMVDRGVFGAPETMAQFATTQIRNAEQELQQAVGRRIVVLPDKAKFIGLLDRIEQQFGAGFFEGTGTAARQLRQSLTSLPGPSAQATDVLALKRYLDSLRSSSSFKLDPNLSRVGEELKIASDAARATVRRIPGAADLLDEQRTFIEAFDALVDYGVRAQRRDLLGITDALLGGAGMIASGPAGMTAAAGSHFLRSPAAMTGAGQALHRLGVVAPAAAPLVPGVVSQATRP